MPKNIKGEAIKHYTRMIRFAEQRRSQTCRDAEMWEELKENWYGSYCSYCICHHDREEANICKLCSLSAWRSGRLDGWQCAGGWNELDGCNYKTSWNVWIGHAKRVRRYIIMKGRVDR